MQEVALEVVSEEKADAQDRQGDLLPASLNSMDKAKHAQLLNERADATQQLEAVLVQLSNPEMKPLQDEHEMRRLNDEEIHDALRGAACCRASERHQNKQVDATLEGNVHTAVNSAKRCLLSEHGREREAADFYAQAKHIFDTLLGPEHRRRRPGRGYVLPRECSCHPINGRGGSVGTRELGGSLSADRLLRRASTGNEWWMQNFRR